MELMKNRIVYVGFAFKHHKGTHAGYHQIRDYIQYDDYIDCQWERDFIDRIIERKNICDRAYIKFFGARLWISEVRCILYSLFHKNVTFHFIYGENILKYLFHFIRNNKIVATYHLPIEEIKKNKVYVKSIRHCNNIVTMSQKDVDEMKVLKGDDKVIFIPHGIDTDFYSLGSKRLPKQILMVGNMLRNFELANNVFKELIKKDNALNFVVVTKQENYQYFKDCPWVMLRTNITNQELLELYQQSTILFLPLYSFTANNALLEAMACGCPVHIASNKIDYSYQHNIGVSVTAEDTLQTTDYLINLLHTHEDKSIEIRRVVLIKYSWPYIAAVVNDVLQNS